MIDVSDPAMQRLVDLKNGKVLPDNYAEEVFLISYDLSLGGASAFDVFGMVSDLDPAPTIEEYLFYVSGFCFGEHDRNLKQTDPQLH